MTPTTRRTGLSFSTADTSAWTKANETSASDYVAGTLHDEEILVHNGNGNTMFGVDPDTFEVTSYGTIASSWQWSDSAANPAEGDLFGKMIGLCMNGTHVEMLNPAEGTLSYWDLSTKGFADDPLATIAYVGSGTYDYNYLWYNYPDCPAHYYYAMTESGELYQFIVFTYTDGENYSMTMADLGNTGLELTNVSAVTAGQYASMIYDQATGYLVVSSYSDGNEAKLYVVSPEDLIPAEVGTFGENVWPVVSLYQYDRATDLTLKVNPTSATIYVGDSLTVSTKVVLGSTNELTWTTSDADVATVEDGVITGTGEGDATITVTTVATNAAGVHVSQDIAISVLPVVPVDATVKAQITNDEGNASWVNIDLSDMTTTPLGNATTTFYGGGYSAGDLYGTDIYDEGGHIYKINPATFEETQGGECSTSYAIRDMTENPAVTFTLTEADGTTHTATTFGDPIYISNSDGLYELVDYVEGSLSGWRANSSYPDLVAITYVGDTTLEVVNTMLPDSSQITEADADTTCHVYYVLNVDGDLYQFITVPTWDVKAAEGEEVSAILVRGSMGNIGVEFDDTMALSAEYVEFDENNYGLLIADATDASIYYANLAGDEIVTNKVGSLNGVSYISSLYTAAKKGNVSDSLLVKMGAKIDAPADVDVAPAKGEEDFSVADTAVEASIRVPAGSAMEVANSFSMNSTLETSDKAMNVSAGSLNAVKLSPVATQSIETQTSNVVVDKDAKTVTVKVTAADTTNGLFELTYDPAVLTLNNVSKTAIMSSIKTEDGKVTVGFADADTFTAAVATVVFDYTPINADVETSLTLTVKEDGTSTAETTETIDVVLPGLCDHTNTEVRNAKAPTCTEEGYTGDLFCKDCGMQVGSGLIIPATGHDPIVVDAKAPTQSHPGYTGDTVCETCGELLERGETIPAKGGSATPSIPSHEEDEKPAEKPEETKPVSELPFVDVDVDDWFYENVLYVYKNGIMNGTSDTTFAPNATLTRGMVVTVLYRLEKEPEVTFSGAFTDVAESDWYGKAVEWAAANGVVNGYGDGKFGPNDAVTVEQLAAILYRYAQLKGYDVTAQNDLTAFADAADVSEYAVEAVKWAVASDLIASTNGLLNAKTNATRAQVAFALHHFIVNVVK